MGDETVIRGEIGQFILTHITSIADIEALLLLRDSPAQHWHPISVAGRIYVSEAQARAVLRRLSEGGLVRSADGGNTFLFACDTTEKQRLVDETALVYRRCLIPVTNLIHSRGTLRRRYSDAFRWRGER